MKPKYLALSVLPALLLGAGCQTSSTAQAPQASPQGAVEAPARPSIPEDPKKVLESIGRSYGLAPAKTDDEPVASSSSPYFTDPATGRRFQRIPKNSSNYEVRNGKIYSSVMAGAGIPYLKEDDLAWYIAAPSDAPPPEKTAEQRQAIEAKRPKPVVIPADESEVVTPRSSKIRLGLEEISDGLPTAGYWRENLAAADLDGDGKLELITPPPRLAGAEPKIFKLKGTAWEQVPATFEGGPGIAFDYGGVVAADMDKDGKTDLVFVHHGNSGGPVIAYNKGGFRFQAVTAGMSPNVSSRAVAVGDLTGSGRSDVVSLSDEGEYVSLQLALKENPGAAAPRADGSAPGYDVRAFFREPDGTYRESDVGLFGACYGNSISLWDSPPDKGEPFFVTGCHYLGLTAVIYGFDREAKSFHRVGVDFAEAYSIHSGTALGTYRGFPAAFVSYAKLGVPTAPEEMKSEGVSLYYRENGDWKRKRVLKAINPHPSTSQGIGVGDLNGDGLDDVVYADDATHRLRVFFQRPDGEFEEMDPALEPEYENHSTAVRVVDVDGDGKKDIVLMYQTGTSQKTRSGGIRYFRNLGSR